MTQWLQIQKSNLTTYISSLLILLIDYIKSQEEEEHVIMQASQNPTCEKEPQKVNVSLVLCRYACLVLYVLNASIKFTEGTTEWDTCGKIIKQQV